MGAFLWHDLFVGLDHAVISESGSKKIKPPDNEPGGFAVKNYTFIF